MSAQQHVHYEVDYDMNHPYIPIEEDIWNILSASEVYEIIDDDLEINVVVVPNVSFSQSHEALAILSTSLEQQ